MKLEAILAMDEEPFDTGVFEAVYYPAYTNSPGLSDTYAMLIFNYYSKFDQKYGTRLMEGIEFKRVLPDHVHDDMEDDMEYDMLWYDHANDILEVAANISGWSIDFLELNECDLPNMLEDGGYQRHMENEKEIFRDIFSEFLLIKYDNDFIRSCYASIADDVNDALSSMEYAVICVMSNEKLDRYMGYRKEHQNVIAAVCPEEDQCIYNLLEKIEYPFQVFYTNKIHECEEEENRGRRFISTLLGNNGDSYCLEGCVNPNWVCSAIKMGMVLDLAFEKITVYENLLKSRVPQQEGGVMPPFLCCCREPAVLKKGQTMREETPLEESCERCLVGIQEDDIKRGGVIAVSEANTSQGAISKERKPEEFQKNGSETAGEEPVIFLTGGELAAFLGTAFPMTEQEADLLVNYMEGHNYNLGHKDGMLYRGDICYEEKNVKWEPDTIDDVVDTVTDWNFEMMQAAAADMESAYNDDHPDYDEKKRIYDCLWEDEKVLDALFDRTKYGKDLNDMANKLAVDFISDMNSEGGLDGAIERMLGEMQKISREKKGIQTGSVKQ